MVRKSPAQIRGQAARSGSGWIRPSPERSRMAEQADECKASVMEMTLPRTVARGKLRAD